MRRARAAIVAVLAIAGCEELLEPEAPSEAELEEVAAAMAAQAQAASQPGSDEPHGESIDACLDRVRRETPPSVQETIEAVGYSELLRDSCRARVAEDERSTVPCAQIEARLVRRACESRVAIATRDPELCPEGAGGHDPLCLALASRDRALCRAARTSSARRVARSSARPMPATSPSRPTSAETWSRVTDDGWARSSPSPRWRPRRGSSRS